MDLLILEWDLAIFDRKNNLGWKGLHFKNDNFGEIFFVKIRAEPKLLRGFRL